MTHTVLPSPRDSVMVQRDGDEHFIIDTLSGEVYHVNETAARIFQFCVEGVSLDEAIRQLSVGLDATDQADLIRQDILETTEQFQALDFFS